MINERTNIVRLYTGTQIHFSFMKNYRKPNRTSRRQKNTSQWNLFHSTKLFFRLGVYIKRQISHFFHHLFMKLYSKHSHTKRERGSTHRILFFRMILLQMTNFQHAMWLISHISPEYFGFGKFVGHLNNSHSLIDRRTKPRVHESVFVASAET